MSAPSFDNDMERYSDPENPKDNIRRRRPHDFQIRNNYYSYDRQTPPENKKCCECMPWWK